MKHLKIIKYINYYKKCQYSTQILEKPIIVEKLGTVTTIGINRPEKRNSLDIETLTQLSNEIHNFETDKSAYVAVLYGIGGNFCAGYDLNEIAISEENAKRFFKTISNLNLTNRFIKKPLVAAISGYAVGSGMELALMCDLRVMEETAVIGFLNRRFGIPTIDGGTVRLGAMAGLPYALDLLLTGRGVSGKEALERGLTTRLVACGSSLGQATNLASSVNKYSQASLNSDRKSMFYSTFEAKSLEDAMSFEKTSINDDLISESVEGARRFLSGIGKHGKFYNIIEKEKKFWENED